MLCCIFYLELSNICAGCLNIIEDDEVLQALNSEWHVDCFRYGAFTYHKNNSQSC